MNRQRDGSARGCFPPSDLINLAGAMTNYENPHLDQLLELDRRHLELLDQLDALDHRVAEVLKEFRPTASPTAEGKAA